MNAYQEPKYEAKNNQLVHRKTGVAIPDDEPVFILRARDPNAAELLIIYARMCKNPQAQEAARKRAAQFTNWAMINQGRMHTPESGSDETWSTSGKKSE